jgi:NADPH:quinone reductase-like Zn-dependent oxidoreductase
MTAQDVPNPPLPRTGLEVRSTLTDDGTVTVGIRRADVAAPAADEVLVRVEAAPVNPSDLGTLFAMADLGTAAAADGAELTAVTASVPPGALKAQGGRLGRAIPAGNEGGGTVIAAGPSPEAQALMGRVVGFLSGDAYAQYRTLKAAQCLAMADGTDPADAAAAFVNPLTALGMVETMRREGHTALVHTVGASNLGLMLLRICAADGVGLVNIVRRPEHVELLRGAGAEHVCDSSAASFLDDLTNALRATGATIAFDAIGGGDLAGTLLACMERVAAERAGEYSRYGSDVLKQVYIYGNLDRGPTTLKRDFGMSWAIGGWLLTPFLAQLGPDRADRLADLVDPDKVRRYGRTATGDKALVTPRT